MKRLYLQGLWLILQVISTYEVALSKINIVQNATLTQLAPTWSAPLNEKSLYNSTGVKQVHTSSSTSRSVTSINSRFTDSLSLSVTSYSHMLVVTSDITQTTRILFNSTQSQNARILFNSAQSNQTQSVKNISAVRKVLPVQPISTRVPDRSTKSKELNSNTSFVQNTSSLMIPRISEMIHRFTTCVGRSPTSSHASGNYAGMKHSTPNNTVETRIIQASATVPQSSSRVEVKIDSNMFFEKSNTVKSKSELNSRSLPVLSSHQRFLLRTQAIQPSKIILLFSSKVTATERLNSRISSASVSQNYALQNTAVEKAKTSFSFPDSLHHRSSKSSRRGNNTYLKKTSELFSTTSKVPLIFPEVRNKKKVSPTFAKKEIMTTKITRLSNEYPNSIPTIGESISTASTTSWPLTSSHKSLIWKGSGKVATSVSLTELYIFTSIFTTAHNQAYDSAPGMPLYVLAICLPLALLLGFGLAFVYFKRNKEDHRMRYSVTVEVASENPEDYELRRMYSIIDVTAGIRKDFLSGLESRKHSIATQLDASLKSTPTPDQPV